MHMKPNASSNLFRYFYFSKGCWGLNSFPIVTLYKHLLHNTIYISSLQSRQLKGVRIMGVKSVEFSILQLHEQHNYSELFNLPAKNTSIRRKTNLIALYFDMCTLLGCFTLGQNYMDKYRGSKEKIPRIMWNPVASGASMEVSRIENDLSTCTDTM